MVGISQADHGAGTTASGLRELLSSSNVTRARGALRKLLGDQVLWFTPVEGGRYELHGETKVGPLFEGCSEVSGAGGGT